MGVGESFPGHLPNSGVRLFPPISRYQSSYPEVSGTGGVLGVFCYHSAPVTVPINIYTTDLESLLQVFPPSIGPAPVICISIERPDALRAGAVSLSTRSGRGPTSRWASEIAGAPQAAFDAVQATRACTNNSSMCSCALHKRVPGPLDPVNTPSGK